MVKVTDAQGNVYTQSIPIVLIDPVQLDQMLRARWSGMTNALVAGNKATALSYLSTPAQAKYGPVFDALMPDLAQIIGSWSTPLKGMLSASIGEYGVVTADGGARHLFLIYFVQGADGVWRLESM